MLDFQPNASPEFNAAVPVLTPEHLQVTDDHAFGMDESYDELLPAAGTRIDSQHALSITLRISPADSTAFNDFRVPFGYDDFADASINLARFHHDHAMHDQADGRCRSRYSTRRPCPSRPPACCC